MTPSASNLGIGTRIGMFLFGFVFLGAGLAAGNFFILSELQARFNARHYVPVQAELLHVELKSHRGEKSATHETKARYRYTFEDKSYTSERVVMSEGADNIGSYQQDLYNRLNTARRRHATVTTWVNPTNPGEAVLEREMRWGLFAVKSVFFFVFTAVGLFVCVVALRATSTATGATAAEQSVLANPAWRDGRVSSGSRSMVAGAWTFAILWNAIAMPLPFLLADEMAKKNWPALLGLLFPLVGLWLLYRAVHATLAWHRFGALILTMDPFPGTVGGAVGGIIELRERFRTGQTFQVSLTCVHQRVSGRDRDRSDHAVWQNEMPVTVEASGRGSRVVFRFEVPPDLPPTAPASDDYHYWSVHLGAELPGIDLDHKFDIPVIAGTGAAVRTATTAAVTTLTPPEIPPNIVRISREDGATVFYYPVLRSPGMGIALLVFSVIFGGATVFLYSATHGFTGIVTGLMALVFGVVTLGMFLFGLYTLGNTLRVEVSARGLAVTRRVFGVPLGSSVPLDEIQSIEPHITSQSQSEGRFNVRYSLRAQRYAGRRMTVGDDIPGHALADYLAQRLREVCGIKPTTK